MNRDDFPASPPKKTTVQAPDGQGIDEVKASLQAVESPPKGQHHVYFSGRNVPLAEDIIKKIVPDDVPDPQDAKYYQTLRMWTEGSPRKYATAIHNMRAEHGDDFTDGFIKYMTQKGEIGCPNYQNLEMPEFRQMLEEAVWADPNNIASQIVSGWLSMGDFDPNPQFLLPLDIPDTLALRLNGYALHPPEADIATCDACGIDTILPGLCTGVRYKIASKEYFRTLFCITLGNVLATDAPNISASTKWKDTGFVLVATIFGIDVNYPHRSNLCLIHNTTDEDVAYGSGLRISYEESPPTVLRVDDTPRRSLLPIDTRYVSNRVSVTPMSYDEPEFAQLGKNEKSSDQRTVIPLFPTFVPGWPIPGFTVSLRSI